MSDQPVPGLKIEVLEHNITAYRLSSLSREAIDYWATAMKKSLAEQPPETPLLVLYDLSAARMAITPYLRARTVEVSETLPHIRVRTAVLVNDQLLARIIQGLLFLIKSQNRERRIFFDEPSALAWLKESLRTLG